MAPQEIVLDFGVPTTVCGTRLIQRTVLAPQPPRLHSLAAGVCCPSSLRCVPSLPSSIARRADQNVGGRCGNGESIGDGQVLYAKQWGLFLSNDGLTWTKWIEAVEPTR